uniref:Uncharacterized protein n=1 Tax=Arcella intermedia TaxID=1963864 RepID=A0A6B2L9Q9_9EUKA
MQVVRYKQGKHTFEVGCKVGSVMKYRKTGQGQLNDILITKDIWKDIKKADRASEHELEDSFGKIPHDEMLKAILEKGHLQLTDGERKEILEKKRNEIINYIHKYYIDPKTKTMIPVARIDNALNEVKARIDPDIATETQVQEILKKLPGVLTLKRAEITGVVKTTHQFIANVTGVFKRYNIAIRQEHFSSEGAEFSISMVPGDYDKVISDLNTATKGEFDFAVDGQGGSGGHVEESPGGKKGGRGGGRGGRGGRGEAPAKTEKAPTSPRTTETAKPEKAPTAKPESSPPPKSEAQHPPQNAGRGGRGGRAGQDGDAGRGRGGRRK